MDRRYSRGWPAGPVLGLLLLLLVGCSEAVDEAVELVGEGGEMVLREPLRQPGDGPRVLVFALDGVGEDELRRSIDSGSLPHIGALLGVRTGESGVYEHAVAVPGVLSILPSTTLAAWSSLFTGEPPARTGVPGNEWYVREEDRLYAPAPVSVMDVDDALLAYTEDLLGGALEVPTLYERADVRSYVALSHVHRGADLLTIPDAGDLGRLFGAVAEGITGDATVEQATYAEVDEAAVDNLVATIRERGLADLQVVYFPGVDLFAHVAETRLDGQRAYLREVLDPAVERVVAEYRRLGALEETYVLFVADHGHTPVLEDDRHALGAEGADEPPAVLERAGFRVRPPTLDLEPGEGDHQAVLAYQGAFAYVYLADRSTCPREGDPCDWSRPPRYAEDVVPAIRAFEGANRGSGVPEMTGTLDLIFSREPRPFDEPALPFEVWTDGDLTPVGGYLERMPRPELLDLEARLDGLGAGPFGHRAGDVLLLARWSPTEVEDRYYFSSTYRSWHGSPTEQDSRIPLIVSRGDRSDAALRDEVQAAIGGDATQLSVTPLILALLGRG